MNKTLRLISESFFSILFFCLSTYLIKEVIQVLLNKFPFENEEIINFVIGLLIILGFFFANIYILFSFRLIYSNSTEILIKRILLFKTYKIKFSELMDWEEMNERQNHIILYHKDSKKTFIYSINCWNYETFKCNLEKFLRKKEKVDLNYSYKF